jgi:hypothetical protein
MKYPHQASGLSQGLPFLIPADWTPEQAQAVVELLDDLRERIWSHYQLPLHELYRQQRLPTPEDDFTQTDRDEPPF